MVLFVFVVAVVVRRRDVLRDGDRFRVDRRPDFLHHRVEAVVIVSGVLDDPHASVGLVDAVGSVDHVAVADLVLGLHVARVGVVHTVIERVLWMSL